MKIGIDARLPAYRMGGISRYVIQLVHALAALDNGAHYVVYESRKETKERFIEAPSLTRKQLVTPCHHRFERWLLSAELLFDDLEVFHSPDFIPPVCGARRHVITVHDLNFLYYPQFLTAESRRYYAGQIEWAVSHADHIIADSYHTRRDLVEQLGVAPSRVTAIHLAADPLFAHAAAHEPGEAVAQTVNRHGLQPGFVLFVGTVEPRKNLPLLIEALAAARNRTGGDYQLVIAGKKGWLYDDVFRKIEGLEMRAHVRHIEEISDVQLAHLYLAAGLLALPSHYEGFGLTALEAMHCRCPVVASNRASIPEVVGDAGVLLPPTDVEAWSAAIVEILDNPLRREQIVAAGVEQASRFSWAQTAAQTQEVYTRLA